MQKIIDGVLVESVQEEWGCYGCEFMNRRGIEVCSDCLTGKIPRRHIWKRVEEKPTPSHLLNRHYIDNLWRWKCGLPEEEEKAFEPIDIDKLAKEQMSERFIKLMTNRMVLGTLRYGRWQDNKKNGVKLDRIGSIRKRLQLFEETGNSEYLVDIANFAMIEFEISDHPNLHFSPKDDDGEHVQKL